MGQALPPFSPPRRPRDTAAGYFPTSGSGASVNAHRTTEILGIEQAWSVLGGGVALDHPEHCLPVPRLGD